MTTLRQYKCDLCGDAFTSSDTHAAREVFGVYFHRNRPSVAGPWLALKLASECERHICLACAKAVHDELRKVMPAAAEQSAASADA